jgi:hypothetical protein
MAPIDVPSARCLAIQTGRAASSPPRAGRNFLGTASRRENPINQRGLRAPLDTVRDVSTRNNSATTRAEPGKIRGICSRDVPQPVARRDCSKIRRESGDLSYPPLVQSSLNATAAPCGRPGLRPIADGGSQASRCRGRTNSDSMTSSSTGDGTARGQKPPHPKRERPRSAKPRALQKQRTAGETAECASWSTTLLNFCPHGGKGQPPTS